MSPRRGVGRAALVMALVGACASLVACVPVADTAAPVSPLPRTQGGAPPAGTPDWQVTHPGPERAIEGFADRVSVLPGEPVRLFVSTTAPGYTVTAFRMGSYTGSDALAVWVSERQQGQAQPNPVIAQPTHTVVAPWQPSLNVATDGWKPGDYLLRLDGENGAQQFVPLTVRTPSNEGRIVVINAVTTWQAYNAWGGYSLYHGPGGKFGDRSRAVSFDRPYQAKTVNGAGDFLLFELAFLRVAERSGVPLGYATDVDLHNDPHLLDGARAMVTLGHDEYWSMAMRQSATRARDRGVNLAFLGGNEVYRHIRMAPTELGPNRLEIGYKSFQEDPASRTTPEDATQEWRRPPHPRPESALLGSIYQCNPARADLVVADADNWLLKGIVTNGQHIPGLVGDEYQRVDLRAPTPRPIQVLFHSPVTCRKHPDFADVTYYTTPSGAGVFAAGTQDWICGLDPNCRGGGPDGAVGNVISAITVRLLQAFAAGPAGVDHPAQDNLAKLGIAGATGDVAPSLPSDEITAP